MPPGKFRKAPGFRKQGKTGLPPKPSKNPRASPPSPPDNTPEPNGTPVIPFEADPREGRYGRIKRDPTNPNEYVDRFTGRRLRRDQKEAYLAKAQEVYEDSLGLRAFIRKFSEDIEAFEDRFRKQGKQITTREAAKRLRKAQRVANKAGFTDRDALMIVNAAHTVSRNPSGVPFDEALDILQAWLRDYKDALEPPFGSRPDFPDGDLYPG